jgi:hypothetical protein
MYLSFIIGGYPDNPGDVPASPGGLSKKDCVVISGFSHVLCFAFRTDNSGPPESVQVFKSYYCLVEIDDLAVLVVLPV